MFLSIEWHHKSAPRGWSWYGAVGAGEMSAERRRQIENERPPYCQCTIKWRDSAGIFWTIEKWLVKDLPNPYGFEAAFVLKRDGEAFSTRGKIALPIVETKYIPGKTILDKGTHVTESIRMKQYNLVPSWFEIDVLREQTIICRVDADGPKIIYISAEYLGYDEVIRNDDFHPVVTSD